MAHIKLNPTTPVDDVMTVVRETFESRDYLWEATEPLTATANEGGRHVSNPVVAQRLRVAVRFDESRHRLVLNQETLGLAYIANGAGWHYVTLASRFRKMVKAVRDDLAAASLDRDG